MPREDYLAKMLFNYYKLRKRDYNQKNPLLTYKATEKIKLTLVVYSGVANPNLMPGQRVGSLIYPNVV